MKVLLNIKNYIFPFGKYKDRYVQDVLKEDVEYCKWFSINIVATKNKDVVQICDYINKYLHNIPYYSQEQAIALSTSSRIMENIPTEWLQFIDKEKLLSKEQKTIDEDYNYNEDYDCNEEHIPLDYDYGGDLFDAMQYCVPNGY